MHITKDRGLILSAGNAAMVAAYARPEDDVDEANADILEAQQLYREWMRVFDADHAVTP